MPSTAPVRAAGIVRGLFFLNPSGVAQWQSKRLLTARLRVRVSPPELVFLLAGAKPPQSSEGMPKIDHSTSVGGEGLSNPAGP